jgi:poly(3-hydroxybutyrate) depolymerase
MIAARPYRGSAPAWQAFLVVLAWSCAAVVAGCSDAHCQVRYQQEVFASYQLQSNIQYGTTATQVLDIYTGTGDNARNRPLVLFIHGGGFLNGDKVSNFGTRVCGGLARRGYVVASINYRLTSSIPNDQVHFEAMLRALQDAKAAVRFFRKFAPDYGIDSSRIYATGSSAGSITALHLAYLDSSEVPSYVNWSAVGGTFEGTSGNPGHASTVQGVISNWGAIGDTAWIHAGDVPLYCVHGTADSTVYFDRVPADGPFLFGSRFVVDRAQHAGIRSGLRLFVNTGHTLDNSAAKQDSAIRDFAAWLYTILGPMSSVLHDVHGELPATPCLHGNFPNPFNPTTIVEYELDHTMPVKLEVLTLLGQHVATLVEGRQSAGRHRAAFTAAGLSSGAYVCHLRMPEGSEYRRMMLLR